MSSRGSIYDVETVSSPSPWGGDDVILVGGDFLGVADGATAVYPSDLTVRRFAMMALAQVARESETKGPVDAITSAIRVIQRELRRPTRELSCSLSYARFRNGELEIGAIGDTLCIWADGDGGTGVIPGEPKAESGPAAQLIARRLGEGRPYGEAWEEALPILRERRREVAAKAVSFGDDPRAGEAVKHVTLPVGDTRAMLLCTDGAGRAVAPFGEVESTSEMLGLAERDGARGIVRLVRAAEERDLLAQRFPRAKPFDDISVVYASGIGGRERAA